MVNRGHAIAVRMNCALAAVLAVGLAPAAHAADKPRDAEKPAGIAVIELFTSDACPSCPAADAFLRELAERGRRTGEKIIPLAFHVDYWNPPGRRDPLSSEAFAQRQQAYVRSMRLEGAYTPQMIVNGTREFVGSQRRVGEQAVRAALSEPAAAQIDLEVRGRDNGRSYQIAFAVEGVSGDAVVNLALVERDVTVQTVRHWRPRPLDHIVRMFRTVPLQPGATQKLELTPPRGVDTENCSIVAYVQSTRDGAVLGATMTDLHPAPVAQASMQPREGSTD